ncbi:MAG: TraR/DksA family transcriptional regulator [bacterium]|nr:TraR/DksA family transcriptional regulator [bacterium]MBK8128449.1 TraR/DksA family transcriptional regulator [bacterium]
MANENNKKRTEATEKPTHPWPDGPKPTLYAPEWKEYFRHLIVERRKEILRELGYLRESSMEQTSDTYSGDSSTYSYHMADQGTDAQEREKAFLFASREGKMLTLLEQAVERIDNGTYGYCMDTGAPIEFRRLEAIPHAKLSIEAKRRLEEAKNNIE